MPRVVYLRMRDGVGAAMKINARAHLEGNEATNYMVFISGLIPGGLGDRPVAVRKSCVQLQK